MSTFIYARSDFILALNGLRKFIVQPSKMTKASPSSLMGSQSKFQARNLSNKVKKTPLDSSKSSSPNFLQIFGCCLAMGNLALGSYNLRTSKEQAKINSQRNTRLTKHLTENEKRLAEIQQKMKIETQSTE